MFSNCVLEKTLKSLLDSKEVKPVHSKGNQLWIFIGRLMLMLKFQYFGHLMQRTDSLEKTLMLGKVEDRRRRGWQKMRWLDGITDSWWTWVWASSRSWWWTGKPGVLQSMGLQRVGHNWTTEQQSVVLNGAALSYVPLGEKIWVQVDPWSPNHVIQGSNGVLLNIPHYIPVQMTAISCIDFYKGVLKMTFCLPFSPVSTQQQEDIFFFFFNFSLF